MDPGTHVAKPKPTHTDTQKTKKFWVEQLSQKVTKYTQIHKHTNTDTAIQKAKQLPITFRVTQYGCLPLATAPPPAAPP